MTEHTHTYTVTVTGGFPGGTVVKNPSVSAGDKRGRLDPWVRKIPLEEEVATHSSILAQIITWILEHGGLRSMGSQRVRHD